MDYRHYFKEQLDSEFYGYKDCISYKLENIIAYYFIENCSSLELRSDAGSLIEMTVKNLIFICKENSIPIFKE